LAQKREKLADILYDAILKSISEKGLKEGDRLPGEEALCETYQVSRPTIREVLARLRAGGVIVSRQGSGSFVGPSQRQASLRFPEVESINDIQHCLEFRRGIECGAAELAARTADQNDLALIEAAYEKLNETIRRGELGLVEDFALHMAIANASRNSYFISMLNSVKEQSLFSMTLSRDLARSNRAERRMMVQNEHRAVVDAIARHDPAAARAAMKAHIQNSIDRIFFGSRKPSAG
jgi:DNA-binding FadR family transcriptional regulator